ncbi:WD40-repeat-containing domain protein [Plectosphaerella cucumerina]|uniref:WD40-repeat-containing domain protein n=1 Tax=Plectosphaerella cucumerina TaxID=40658 RepID=A0A8K0TPP8_9PEZI|nr:WD40-repeat-containing domain protein [Plectosphaerella cucumerina]
MMKEHLDSDRLNYLVWRYLLEGNYREAAAKFQKEWHISEPHRHFDFARHVKSHALVSVVNKGLCYNALEREHARKLVAPDAQTSATVEAPQIGVFGPITPQPPQKIEEEDDAAMDEVDGSRKRQLESGRSHQHQMNGSPAKRPRLSNGYENGVDAATTPMELDHQTGHHADRDNNHAYPSPLEGEQAPSPIPHTEGPEQGTQVEKVQELAPETTFLRLVPDDASDDAAAAAASPSSPQPSSDNAPVLLRCEWNPKDPSILAAAGTDALACVWTVSRATAVPSSAEPGSHHVNGATPPSRSLLDQLPRSATVSQMAWNSAGTSIAVAADHDGSASVLIVDTDGNVELTINVAEGPVLRLCWNPNDSALLSIIPFENGARVTINYPAENRELVFLLPGHDLMSYPLDATWVNDTDFLLCGGDVMVLLRCTETEVMLERKLETKPDDQLAQVRYDERSRLAATSSLTGALDLWDDAGQRQTISAHSGTITALQWQPLPEGTQPEQDERLLASGGDDGAILIWNARRPDQKAKCFLTMDGPIVGLAFTPDGAFIAGATVGRILIWKVGEHAVPRASWSRTPHPGWLSPKTNSESEDEDEHCLGWDCDGQKLAYGANSRLAVINFRR